MLELEEDSLAEPEETRSGVAERPLRESLREDSDSVDSVLDIVKDRFKFELPSYFSVNVDIQDSSSNLLGLELGVSGISIGVARSG